MRAAHGALCLSPLGQSAAFLHRTSGRRTDPRLGALTLGLSRAPREEPPGPWPRPHPHLSGSERREAGECPCLRQSSKQVTAIVLLGVVLGKVFQVPFGELLLGENNDYFREVFSVNNIPQVSGFPAPVTFFFDDGSGFQDQRSLLLMTGPQETPREPALLFPGALGTRGAPHRRHAQSSHCPQSLPSAPLPAGFPEEESEAQGGM